MLCVSYHRFLKSLAQHKDLSQPSHHLPRQLQKEALGWWSTMRRLAQEHGSWGKGLLRIFLGLQGYLRRREGDGGKGEPFLQCRKRLLISPSGTNVWLPLSSPWSWPRKISLSEGPWAGDMGMSGSLLPSLDVEHISLLFLRERGIIGQIIHSNPPWLPRWQVLGYSPRSLEAK